VEEVHPDGVVEANAGRHALVPDLLDLFQGRVGGRAFPVIIGDRRGNPPEPSAIGTARRRPLAPE
jgi:hypothetical protein